MDKSIIIFLLIILTSEIKCTYLNNDLCPLNYELINNTNICVRVTEPSEWDTFCLDSGSTFNLFSNDQALRYVYEYLVELNLNKFWLPIQRDPIKHDELIWKLVPPLWNKAALLHIFINKIDNLDANCLSLDINVSRIIWKMEHCNNYFHGLCFYNKENFHFIKSKCSKNYFTPIYGNHSVCYSLSESIVRFDTYDNETNFVRNQLSSILNNRNNKNEIIIEYIKFENPSIDMIYNNKNNTVNVLIKNSNNIWSSEINDSYEFKIKCYSNKMWMNRFQIQYINIKDSISEFQIKFDNNHEYNSYENVIFKCEGLSLDSTIIKNQIEINPKSEDNDRMQLNLKYNVQCITIQNNINSNCSLEILNIIMPKFEDWKKNNKIIRNNSIKLYLYLIEATCWKTINNELPYFEYILKIKNLGTTLPEVEIKYLIDDYMHQSIINVQKEKSFLILNNTNQCFYKYNHQLETLSCENEIMKNISWNIIYNPILNFPEILNQSSTTISLDSKNYVDTEDSYAASELTTEYMSLAASTLATESEQILLIRSVSNFLMHLLEAHDVFIRGKTIENQSNIIQTVTKQLDSLMCLNSTDLLEAKENENATNIILNNFDIISNKYITSPSFASSCETDGTELVETPNIILMAVNPGIHNICGIALYHKKNKSEHNNFEDFNIMKLDLNTNLSKILNSTFEIGAFVNISSKSLESIDGITFRIYYSDKFFMESEDNDKQIGQVEGRVISVSIPNATELDDFHILTFQRLESQIIEAPDGKYFSEIMEENNL